MRALDEPPPAPDGARAVSGRQALKLYQYPGATGLEPATSGLTERDALGCTASPKWCNSVISHGEQWEITRTALLDLVGPNRGGLEGRGHGRGQSTGGPTFACAAAGRSEKSAGRPRADALVGHPTAILRPAGSDVHRKHPRRCNRQVNFRDGQRVETGTGFAREAGCLFRIPFEVSALQPRRRITPPLRKALLVQIGGPQCTVGKHSGPPRIPCPGAVLAPPHPLMRFAGNLPP